VQAVVADTGPLQYLLLIDCIDLLPRLFTAVTVPAAVQAELLHPGAPRRVRDWAGTLPEWITLSTALNRDDARFRRLGPGERDALSLALILDADLVLMDDRAGVAAAVTNGLAVIGTIGVIERAARRELIDLEAAIARLMATNFRYSPQLLDALLARHGKGGTL
jgi:predicted nucleic acid-binding protein